MRILAIDPAIRNTGYAVVEGDYRRARALDYGTLTIPRSVSQSGCLLAIKQHLGNLIDKWNPDEMAVERIIYVQSHQTAITMGAAKAAVVIAAAEAGLRIMEYSPKREAFRRRARGRSKNAGRLHGAGSFGTPGNAGIRCRRRSGDRPHPPLLCGPFEGPHDGEEIHLAVMRDERKTALAARELKFDCPALFSNH